MIKKVETKEEAIRCNQLLTKLINDEKKYNQNINSDFVVSNWFENIYNDKNKAIFISIEEQKIVGYIYVKISNSGDETTQNKEGLIDGLYIEKEYRNRGIATALVEEAKVWAKEQNIKFLYLEVINQNTDAINLYMKQGFSEFSKRLVSEIV